MRIALIDVLAFVRRILLLETFQIKSIMNFIIWSYKEGKYIDGKFTFLEAERYVTKEAKKDVEQGLENTLIEAKENGYLIEAEDFIYHGQD